MEKKICRFFALVLALAVVFSLTGCASYDYKTAVSAFEKGDYAAAEEMFRALGDYEDSADKLKECSYQLASAALYDKRYEEAVAAFEALGDYKDSKKQMNDASNALIKEKLLGEWVCENVDYTGVMTASIMYALESFGQVSAEEFFEFFPITDFILTETAEFNGLGNYSTKVTEESCEKAMTALDETLYGGFSDFVMFIMTKELEAQGLTLDQLTAYYGSADLDEIFTVVLGMDIDEFYELAFEAVFSMDAEDFGSHGSYTVEDGRIILHTETGNEVAQLDIAADSLTLTGEGIDLSGMDEQMKRAIMDCYPMVYVRN